MRCTRIETQLFGINWSSWLVMEKVGSGKCPAMTGSTRYGTEAQSKGCTSTVRCAKQEEAQVERRRSARR